METLGACKERFGFQVPASLCSPRLEENIFPRYCHLSSSSGWVFSTWSSLTLEVGAAVRYKEDKEMWEKMKKAVLVQIDTVNSMQASLTIE